MEHLKNMRERVGQFAHDKKPWVKQAFYAGLGCGVAVFAASFLPCGDKLSTGALTAVGGAGTVMSTMVGRSRNGYWFKSACGLFFGRPILVLAGHCMICTMHGQTFAFLGRLRIIYATNH